MSSENSKKNYAKYVAVLLVLVILIASAFLFLELWDNTQGKFAGSVTEYGVITYNGIEYEYRDDIETFLVLGLDKYIDATSAESHDGSVQADFLLLFVFDNKTKQTTAIHINRDTLTKVNKLAIGGTSIVESYTKQIALAYSYVDGDNDKIRCRNTKDSVEYLLKGIKVNHYFSLTMEAVIASCDAVGGVELTVVGDFAGIDDSLIEGETLTLSGEQALRYVRTRYGLEDSSNSTRMERQQQYINALHDKIDAHMDADAEFLVKLVDAIDDYVVYDSSDQKMLKLAEKFEDYEFLGIRELDGEAILGEEFIEFHPDEESIWKIVVELFYSPK